MKRWSPGRACDRILLAASKSSFCTRVSALTLSKCAIAENRWNCQLPKKCRFLFRG